MSAWKQAGFSFNKYLTISARTVRNTLKPEFKAAAEKRTFTEAKVIKFENGVAKEAVPLKL